MNQGKNWQPRNSNEVNENIKTHSLLLPHQGEKGSTIENIKMEVIYKGKKLESQFNIKDPIPKRNNHNIIHHTIYSEDNEDYIGECPRRLEERTKDCNGRDKSSHMLRHSIESGHDKVS